MDKPGPVMRMTPRKKGTASMKRFHQDSLRPSVLALLLMCVAIAHSQNGASISGRIVSETALPLRATVALSFATARGYPAPPWRVRTNSTGVFTFSKLPAGTYSLCAQVASAEPALANSPYVDTCLWGSGQAPVTLTAGQQVTGVVFTAVKGALLSVHVADPGGVLPATAAKAPAPLDPALQIILKGPDGRYRHARYVSSDATGRTYQIAIPLNTALGLQVLSSVANVFDQNGDPVQEASPVAVQPASPSALGTLSFTLQHK